jgi:transmembrane sensor
METKIRNKVNWEMLASYLSENLSESDKLKVRNWIEESQENRKMFHQVEKLWNLSEKVKLADVNIGNAWDKVNTKAQIRQKREFNIFRQYGNQIIRIAAVLVIGFLTVVLIRSISNKQTIIAGSDILELALNDGSHVDLNKNAQLQFPKTFKGHTREVFLQGEAYFEIAHNPRKPFIIHTPEVQIKVLGTSFNMNSSTSGDVEIIVNTGTVELTSNKTKNSVVLHKNERALFSAFSNSITKDINTDLNYLSWKTMKFIFRETRLEDVFQKLEHVYNIHVVVNDPSILDLKLNATYDKAEVEVIVNFICKTFGLHSDKEGSLFVFKRK